KSVSIAFQRCQKFLEAGVGRSYQIRFTLIRFVSSGPQLAAFELKSRHVLIMIHDILPSTMRN
ncbi:hypothetical protein, partial [Lactiplantibacillus pentosus]